MIQLKLHLISRHGIATVDKMFYDIQMMIIHSLLAVQPVMMNDKHCFELYGYDVMFDDEFKPWLIEVNASPSLKANTKKLIRKNDIRSYRSDPRLAKKILNWKAKTSFKQIIYKMVNEQLY